jgi:hypothetical protein
MTRGNVTRATRSGLAAASLVNVAMFDYWKMILDPARSVSREFLPTSEACWAAVTVCMLAFLVGSLLAAAVDRAPAPAVRVVADLLLLGGSLLIINPMRPDAWIGKHGGEVLIVPGVLLALLSLRWRREMVRAFARLLLIVSPFLIVTVGRAGVLALTTDFAALARPVPSLGLERPRPGMRVVVLVFDEMDFNFAFTSRPPSVALPAFDSLRRHAFFATDAHAPARSTSLSIPSYLIGRPVDSIISTAPGKELVRVSGEAVPLDIAVTPGIFDDAVANGARSAVVGFHVPYCHLAFARQLDHCTWRPMSRGGVLDGPVGLPRAVLRQVLALLVIGNRLAHADRIRFLQDAGIRAASDSALRFAFVHLPVPHLPPVWDERHRRYSWLRLGVSGYFGNLMLADHVLGSILGATQRAGLLDHTVFVVTSDHPWRFGPIDGIARGETVPFIVRLPAGAHLDWTRRFETVRLRALVNALLAGGIHDTAGLAAWAALD